MTITTMSRARHVEDEHLPVINIALPDSFNLPAGFYYLWPGAIAAE